MMVKIKIRVPEQRERAGFITIEDGSRIVIEDVAAVTADKQIATRQSNPGRDPLRPGGHAAFGRYALLTRATAPRGAESEYGTELLLFEPVSGAALDAEAYGRLGLLVYAGPRGRDMFLRRTQGGVRLSQRAMSTLLEQLENDSEAELTIEALPPRRWWAFWRKHDIPPRLSNDPPRFDAPPLDEATLLAHCLRTAVRRPRAQPANDDAERWGDRDSSSGSGSRSSSDYRGGGGSGGGGGASGGWSDAPAAGRGPGVSAAGVIIGAAGMAAAAAVASAGNDAEQASGSEAGDTSDSPRSSDAESSSSASDTSTSY